MISRIRMRIFIPMLILTVLFPVLSWMIFSSTSDWYMNRLSNQSLTVMMDSIRTMADRLYSGSDDMTRQEEKDLSKELMVQVRTFIKKDRPQAQLLTMNSRLKLTYPKEENYRPDTQALYEVAREMISDREIAGEMIPDREIAGNDTGIREVAVGDSRYLISLYEIESSGNIRGKYMFGYVAVPDTHALLSYTGTLLLLIAGALCLLSLIAAWFIAGSISKPLRALCSHTRAIGKGYFPMAREPYSIRELEELRCSFNRMTGELEQMNRQQTAFFQNASHELRTPLMSICGYAQGIQCNVFPNHGEAAGVILDETMRMKELVDGILTISKMDGGHLVLDLAEMDLAEFVRDEITVLKGMEITEHIRLSMTALEHPVSASADRALLSRAFRNVISNCARYASGQVDVSVSSQDGSALITVEDDGPGFCARDLPHIFDRFYKGTGGNFGIGLSITAAAMEYMGGKAEARNREEPEHGAVFLLRLPLNTGNSCDNP